MAEFQFPNPASETTAYNAETGTTYEWKANPGKWVIVKAEPDDSVINDQVADNTRRIIVLEQDYTTTDDYNSLSGRITTAQSTANSALSKAEDNERAIDEISEPLTYQIGTDKVMRSGEPSIELVDSEGYYTNVKFQGRNGIAVSSDLISIIIDAEELQTRIAAVEEAIVTLTSLIPPADIGNVTITSSVDVPGDGNAATGQGNLFIMTAINDGESQHGLRYKWTIKRGAGRISGSTTQQSCTATCNDPAPSTVEFQCVVSHPTVADETKIATLLVLVADG